jgi:putative sterol carrier protein
MEGIMNRKFIIILCIIMALSSAVYAEESTDVELGTPEYLTLEVENDCFKLGWKNPMSNFAFQGVEYQIDFREGRGDWISAHRELPTGELPTIEAGRSYVTIDPMEEGLIDDSIDLDNNSYSFRIRYKYLKNGTSEYIYSNFSSPVLLGFQPLYQNASKWAFEELDKASEVGMIPEAIRQDMKKVITREEFSEVVIKLYELHTGITVNYEGQSFKDTNEPDVLKAAKLGIVKGVGDGNFSPKTPVTRQEMAVMLKRTLELMYPNMDFSYGKNISPTPESNIAEWAIHEVNFMREYDILMGDSNGLINPTEHTTREQAVVLTYRTYKKFK